MNSKTPTLSIVTPSYNRGTLLQRCYESLLRQTNKDFEWIIVDDGSTDNTEEIAGSFSGDFRIRYIKKENGGKHTALNASHRFITGEYVTILDSDDYLTDTAVQQIIDAWRRYEADTDIGIVIFLRGSALDQPFCKAKNEGVPVDIMRYQRVCFYSMDCCEVIRAGLFKKYPFPVFAGERFISEGALWNRVSFSHKCVYVNSVVYIGAYLDGGLTKSGRAMRIRNPRGGMYTANLNANRKNFFKKRIKNGLLYTCYSRFAGLSVSRMLAGTDSKLLMLCCLPAGWLLYRYWKKKYM